MQKQLPANIITFLRKKLHQICLIAPQETADLVTFTEEILN